MDTQIKKVLKELYNLEPSLKQYETEVVRIIEEMMAHKPDTHFDSQFVADLRAKLLVDYVENYPRSSKWNIFNYNVMNKVIYGIGGAVLTLFIAVPLIYIGITNTTVDGQKDGILKLGWNAETTIVKADDHAFGTLTGSVSGMSGLVDGRGSGNESFTMRSSDVTRNDIAHDDVKGLGGGDGVADMRMIMPVEWTNYNFIYVGDEFELPEGDTVEVLQRKKGAEIQNNMSQLLHAWDIGLLNLGEFATPRIENITLYEDREFGYSLNLNTVEGSINIYEYFPRWKHTYPECHTSECYESLRLSIQDIPTDSELISIANNFLDEYGISRSLYGNPEVDSVWRTMYDRSEDKNNYFIPEMLMVRYPLIINGMTVYDESGNADGIGVTINIRQKRVSGVGNLTTQQYTGSAYVAETNKERILEFALKGVPYQARYENPTKTVDVTLGTPVMGYVKQWKYEQDRSQEYLIPAFLFPVIDNNGSDFMYHSHIAVPLATEVLEYYEQNRQPPMQIMPYSVDGDDSVFIMKEPAVSDFPSIDVSTHIQLRDANN